MPKDGSEGRARPNPTTGAEPEISAGRTGWKPPRRGRTSTGKVLIAFLFVGIMLAVGLVAATQHVGPQEVTTAISLSFGSNPVSNQLNVSFSRVAYLTQPVQWNTTGFINSSLSSAGTPWWDNSTNYGTHYGIAQFNATGAAHSATVDYHVSGSMGTNISYVFFDQRFAVNGTIPTFGVQVAETALAGGTLPTTGSVLNAAAGAAQNAIWVTATNASGNVLTLTVYDWQKGAGTGGAGYQNVTSFPLSPAVTVQPLEFYDLYIYAQPTQTVVSLVNTTDGAVLGSTAAMKPELDGNLSKVAYLSDEIYSGGVTDAMILDSSWLVDHNTYANEPVAAVTQRGLAPMVTGDMAVSNVDPFDPAAMSARDSVGPSSTSSFSNTAVQLSDFPVIENSSTQDMLTSGAINASDLIPVNGIGAGIKGFNPPIPTTVDAAHALATVRAEGENAVTQTSAQLYTTSWTGSQIGDGIHSFLTNYISAQTGVPPADIQVPSFFVNDISVDTQFTSQAAQTVHDYLATSIPGYLSNSSLALVNTTTGAIEAGADIGSFMDLTTGTVYPAQVSTDPLGISHVYDPVTHQWYASAVLAGFPVGSTVSVAGAIYVPDQAPFLGWTASGVPIFGPTAGCFIVCVSSPLTGAAAAVSSFFGGAASTVTNAIGTVSKAVSGAVVKPVVGTVAQGISQLTSDVSQGMANVMPAIGGTLANIAGDVSGTVTHTLSGVGSGIASATSQIGGALLAGVSDMQTTMYHVVAAAGSAVATAAGAVARGLTVVGNTVGGVLSTAAGVMSNTFASVGNTVATVGKEALGAVSGTLSAIGGTLEGIGSTLLNAVEAPLKALAALFNFPVALASGISAVLEYVTVGVVVAVVIGLVLWLVVLRPRRRGKGREIGKSHERGRRRVHRSHKAAVRLSESLSEWDVLSIVSENERCRRGAA